MKNVTVTGLGVMGIALARTLLQNGFNVTVWNRSLDKAETLKDEGPTVQAPAMKPFPQIPQ